MFNAAKKAYQGVQMLTIEENIARRKKKISFMSLTLMPGFKT
jgi:hypothetical protein